jgi:hypothetical protein
LEFDGGYETLLIVQLDVKFEPLDVLIKCVTQLESVKLINEALQEVVLVVLQEMVMLWVTESQQLLFEYTYKAAL